MIRGAIFLMFNKRRELSEVCKMWRWFQSVGELGYVFDTNFKTKKSIVSNWNSKRFVASCFFSCVSFCSLASHVKELFGWTDAKTDLSEEHYAWKISFAQCWQVANVKESMHSRILRCCDATLPKKQNLVHFLHCTLHRLNVLEWNQCVYKVRKIFQGFSSERWALFIDKRIST